jgi:hypothetical protein
MAHLPLGPHRARRAGDVQANGDLMRKLLAAFSFSALAFAGMAGVTGTAQAADLPGYMAAGYGHGPIHACAPREHVELFNDRGTPTVAGRTPYYTCVTGEVLLPGEIPPPPEYCCH